MKNAPHTIYFSVAIILMFVCLLQSSAAQTSDRVQTEEEARKVAQKVFELNRVKLQRELNELELLFPDQLNGRMDCYKTAFSSYIEYQWNEIAKQKHCEKDYKLCALPPDQDPAKSLWEGYRRMGDNDRADYMSGLSALASINYNYLRAISYTLYPKTTDDNMIQQWKKNHFTPTLKDQFVQMLKTYSAKCTGMEPVGGYAINSDLPSGEISEASIKLGMRGLLLENQARDQLPNEKKDLVSCLATLTAAEINSIAIKCQDNIKCMETKPLDNKIDLQKKLNDLYAHQCQASYANSITE